MCVVSHDHVFRKLPYMKVEKVYLPQQSKTEEGGHTSQHVMRMGLKIRIPAYMFISMILVHSFLPRASGVQLLSLDMDS